MLRSIGMLAISILNTPGRFIRGDGPFGPTPADKELSFMHSLVNFLQRGLLFGICNAGSVPNHAGTGTSFRFLNKEHKV